jgi:protein O-GlcNAc transferase
MSQVESSRYAALLERAEIIVEYGSGGSTLLAVKSGAKKIISIEGNRKWVSRLRRNWRIRLAEILGRLDLRYVNIGPVTGWSMPKGQVGRHLWSAYALAPWRTGISADLVLVDGRFRVACIAQTVLNSSRATIVVHDFWNRPYYHAALQILDEVSCDDTMGVFTSKLDHHQQAAQLYKRFYLDPR